MAAHASTNAERAKRSRDESTGTHRIIKPSRVWRTRLVLAFMAIVVLFGVGFATWAPIASLLKTSDVSATRTLPVRPSLQVHPEPMTPPQDVTKPTQWVVKVDYLNVRTVSSTIGNKPIHWGALTHGTVVTVVRIVSSETDHQYSQWAQLTNGKWVWLGGLNAVNGTDTSSVSSRHISHIPLSPRYPPRASRVDFRT